LSYPHAEAAKSPPKVSPHEDSLPHRVARKTVQSILALGVRQVFTMGLSLLGGALLARLLSPAEFGLYAISTFLLSFLAVFGDAGLAASLIRQPEEPLEEDLRAVFTVQQLLVVAAVAIFWIAAPWVASAYQLPPLDAWLFRLIALSLACVSFQVIPSVRLERHLSFDKLAMVDVATSFVFYGAAVALAWKGLGEFSFALALLARSLVGAILINWLSPWRIGWCLNWGRVRAHLRFGLPYQGIGFTSLLKDSLTPVFIGLLLGPSAVGYLNWAGMVAAYPVLALMVLQRVYLPAFSRLQSYPEALGPFVEKVVLATNALVAPVSILALVLIEPVTRIVFGDKWLAAIPLFYLLWVANIFVPTGTPLMALLNALGRSRTTFLMALTWMAGSWIVGVPLILRFGTIGYALANVAVQFTNLMLYRIAKSYVNFRIWPVVVPVWAWAGVLGLGAYILKRALPPTRLLGLGGQFSLEVVCYLLGLVLLFPVQARKLIDWLRREGWGLAFQWS
jgi:O-antigen/teichoic acid export membrane protein